MGIHDIVLRSVVTEESMNLMDDKKYIFDVLILATKAQVRNVVEEISDIKAENVNIMNVHDKEKKVGRYIGKAARHRKAIIILAEGSNDIKIFNDDKENQ